MVGPGAGLRGGQGGGALAPPEIRLATPGAPL